MAAVVRIEEVADTTVDHLKDVAGITGRDTVLVRLRRLMFPDPLRFPRYGGHTLEAGTIYRIEATPFDKLLTTDPIRRLLRQPGNSRLHHRGAPSLVLSVKFRRAPTRS